MNGSEQIMKNPIDAINKIFHRACDLAEKMHVPTSYLEIIFIPWIKIYFFLERKKIARIMKDVKITLGKMVMDLIEMN